MTDLLSILKNKSFKLIDEKDYISLEVAEKEIKNAIKVFKWHRNYNYSWLILIIAFLFTLNYYVWQGQNNAKEQLNQYQQTYKLQPKFKTIIPVYCTVYNATPEQCDVDCFTTSDGSKVDSVWANTGNNLTVRWCGASQDLLKFLKYGDTIIIVGAGFPYDGQWILHDTGNKRFKNRVDFLVPKSWNKKYPLSEHAILLKK